MVCVRCVTCNAVLKPQELPQAMKLGGEKIYPAGICDKCAKGEPKS